MRDWKTGNVESKYDLHDYEETWGNVKFLVDTKYPCKVC